MNLCEVERPVELDDEREGREEAVEAVPARLVHCLFVFGKRNGPRT